MNEPRNDIDRIAENVADGTPVEWIVEESRHPELKELLEPLRALEALGQAYRQGDGSPWALDETSRVDLEGASPAQWGALRIVSRLGEGGFGTVYRAHDPSLQREVALKLWKPDRLDSRTLREGYLREARKLARVRHPGVLVVHGAEEHDGRVGIWTDFLEGETLEASLNQRGPFNAQEAVLIGLDLCRALAAVHAAGLVHRDVKTTNVMREKGGRLVLLDFGASSELDPATERGSAPTWGTPMTMAPEQLQGEVAGAPTDVYGVGVLLYRLVSGRYPYEADSLSDLRRLKAGSDPVPLLDRNPDLPHVFVNVVHRALARNPKERFQSVGALSRALAESVGTTPPSDLVTVVPPWRRLRWMVGVALAGAAVLLFAILPSLRRGADRRPTTNSNGAAAPAGNDAAVIRANAGATGGGAGQANSGHEAAGVLTASVRLYRVRGADRSQLLPGASVRIGDGLFLEAECPEPVYLYVLNEDSKGEDFVLFPIAGLREHNPLAPGQTHRLPGLEGGRLMNWEVTSAGGGGEVVLVIASRNPQPDLERDIASFRRAADSAPGPAYAQLSERTTTALRGIGGMIPAPEEGRSAVPARLSDGLRALSNGSSAGLWTWQIQLRNATPR